MREDFSTFRFLLRSLAYYWRVHAAVGLACAVAVAVLTGSLLVGDSMRYSLRRLVLEGLGRVDHALVSDLFLRESLAADVKTSETLTCPAILMPGSVVRADTGARANRVQVMGVNEDFWRFGDGEAGSGLGIADWGLRIADWGNVGEREAVVNAALARDLGAKEGDDVLVRIQKPSAAPRETFLGEKDDTLVVLRLRVARVAPSEGLGRFSLQPSQQEPRNIFIPLATLQRRLEEEGRVNTILATGDAKVLEARLREKAMLEDAGLHLRERGRYVTLESDRVFLSRYASDLGTNYRTGRVTVGFVPAPCPVLAYLVNDVRVRDRSIPYSMAVAISDGFRGDSLAGLAVAIKEGEVLLNQWAADDLAARPGDPISLTYYVEGTGGFLKEEATTLTVRGVLPMDNPLVDAALVPEFKGIADADKVADWHAPFPIDLKRVRQKDEDYWEKYRTKAKVIVSPGTGRKLWSNRFGDKTSLVWSMQQSARVRAEILKRFDPSKAGLRFEAVKEAGLRAGSGSTDFGGLFIGFSLFLLIAAAMLIQVLFRLGVEGRAREFGLLGAVGFWRRDIRRLMMAEGGIVALEGGALGVAAGVLYAKALVHGLNTWWAGSIGTSFLRFAASWGSLAIGFAGGWAIAMGAVWLASRSLSRMPARALLSGRSEEDQVLRGRRRLSVWVGGLCVAAAGALAFAAPTRSASAQAMVFFSVGALLLVGSLAFFRAWLGGDPAARPERLSLTRLGTSATKRKPGRSLMVAGLMASATFLIVAVGANRQAASGRYGKDSGTGGFALLAESSVPIYRDVAGMEFADPARKAAIAQARIYPMRLKPGEDASCLNLYRSTRPRVAGVGEDFIRRGGFHFSGIEGKVPEGGSPWQLLEQPQRDGAIPAIGDYTTVYWLLHLKLGGEIVIDGVKLRIVGLLDKSVFQSELLISEANFKRVFPDRGGWQAFAVDAPADQAEAVGAALEAELGDYGFDATGAAERLNELMRVENTYLSTFLSLGGLGLLLGTLGLALALLRNLIERRAEFALLRAVGYRFRDQLWLVLAENGLLITVGMGAGTLCALVAMVPALASRSALVPWGGLVVVLAGVFAFGMAAAAMSAWAALRGPVIRVLKEER